MRLECKYVPEIECIGTISCVECFKEEDVWVKRWILYIKLREYNFNLTQKEITSTDIRNKTT